MKKLAFFVEGFTEQLFLERLLTEIAGVKNVNIEKIKPIGKRGAPRVMQITARAKSTNKKYYILIVDCSGDSKVQSDILDSYGGLIKQGYVKVLGLRDVYPYKYSDISKLEKAAKKYLPTPMPVSINILLAVMEVEAWFIAEHLHFEKIDRKLTHSLIKSNLSHDLLFDDIEKIHHPAEELNRMYSLVGKRYNKKASGISRTVNVLDYSHLYLTLDKRVKYLKKLIGHVDMFFT